MCSLKSFSKCHDELTTRFSHCGHCVSVCDGKCKGKDDIPTFEKKQIELESVTKLKENINKYLDKQSINCAEQQELIKDLKNQLNNGEFDE